GLLRGGEAGSIDSVVDVLVNERIDAIDLLAQRRRIIVRPHVGEAAEGAVEHADDLGRLVVDDGAALPIPQRRHADAAAVARIGAQIDLGELAGTVHAVRNGAGARPEPPAVRTVERLEHRHRDHVFEPLEHAHDYGAMRPRAGQRHVEMVAPARGGKAAFTGRAGAAALRHPVAKALGRAHETAARRARAVLLVLPDAVDQKAHAKRPLFACPTVAYLIIGADAFTSPRDRQEAARRAMDLPAAKC